MAANRTIFGENLAILDQKVFLLARKTMQQIATTAEALEKYDQDIARGVIENDNELDDLELEINDDAILLIAKQQPVATDLRRIITAMKISSDLERIADYACETVVNYRIVIRNNIAEIVRLIKEKLEHGL